MEQAQIERMLRGIAGALLIVGVALIKYHNPAWIWFVLFIGINLLQSAFTNWCPMMSLLAQIFKKKTKSCCCDNHH